MPTKCPLKIKNLKNPSIAELSLLSLMVAQQLEGMSVSDALFVIDDVKQAITSYNIVEFTPGLKSGIKEYGDLIQNATRGRL